MASATLVIVSTVTIWPESVSSYTLHSQVLTTAGPGDASFILTLCGPRNKLGTVQLPWQKITTAWRDLALHLRYGQGRAKNRCEIGQKSKCLGYEGIGQLSHGTGTPPKRGPSRSCSGNRQRLHMTWLHASRLLTQGFPAIPTQHTSRLPVEASSPVSWPGLPYVRKL